MVEATSSLPPIRYWVDVILTTAGSVSGSTANAKPLLTRKSMPVCRTLKRWWRTPIAPEGKETSSIGAKQSTAIMPNREDQPMTPRNSPTSAPGGQRPPSETQLRTRVQMMIAWEARREARKR